MYPVIDVDRENGSVYIFFGPPDDLLLTTEVQTVGETKVNMDFNKDGKLIGIEILALLYPNWDGTS